MLGFAEKFFILSCSVIGFMLVFACVLHGDSVSLARLQTAQSMVLCARALSATLLPCSVLIKYIFVLKNRKS